MTKAVGRPGGRDAQRLLTRDKVFDAATDEFKREGVATADVGRIVTQAGVARGTFYFHFPSKEHVVLELERREEVRIAREFAKFLDAPHDLSGALTEVVRLVLKVERRLGPKLFKDVLALHFSSSRPPDDDWTDHPLIVQVIGEIETAKDRGDADRVIDAYHSGVFYLLGLYALLTTTTGSRSARAEILDKFVVTAMRSLEPR